MKKIISLALAAGLLVGAGAQTAQASKFDIAGALTVTGNGFSSDLLAEGATDAATLKITERVQLSLGANISDEVKAKVTVRMPANSQFGTLANANTQVILRDAYIDFPVAMLNVRAGVQSYTLPGYLGGGVNPVLDDVVSGFLVSADFGMIAPELSWFVTEYDTTIRNLLSLTLPVSLADGMVLTPWVSYDGSNNASNDTYIGATFDVDMSGLAAGVGILYSLTDTEAEEASNLLISANAAMNLGALTPGIAVWYGMAGAGAGTPENTGSWGAFNGSAEALYDNAMGLQTVNTGSINFWDALGVAVSVNDIALGQTTALGAYVAYIMSNEEEVTFTGSNGQVLAELGFGVNLATEIASGVDFMVEANGYMPMASNVKNADMKLGASLAATVKASF